MPHFFGGAWTEIKLDAVQYYLECYTKALKRVGFDLWYIDAFAGTGEREEVRESGGILEGSPITTTIETLAGSARRALEVSPPFDHLHFNEQNQDRKEILLRLKGEHPSRHIIVTAEDANSLLAKMFSSPPWLAGPHGKIRGVVFLDPYALQVEWRTLEILARTASVDVWYLFPLRDVTRQLAHSWSGIGPKEARLDTILSERWRDLYSLPAAKDDVAPTDLFGNSVELEMSRNATQRQIEQWFKQRLETIFPYASEPLPLLTGGSRQAFSLFLAVANPSSRATDLAKHFHRYVMKNFGPGASRRKFDP